MLPASIGSGTPVMYLAASEQRNSTASDTSLGSIQATPGRMFSALERLADIVLARILDIRREQLERRVVDHERRPDRGGAHRVDADPVRAALLREDLHEPDDAMLRSRVVSGVLVRAQAGGGAGEDQAAAFPALDHRGQRGAHRVEHAGQVDVDHLVPLLRRHLPGDGPRADPGVRADDVDPAELGQAGLDRPLELGKRADVGDRLDRAAAGRLDLFHGGVEIVLGRQLVGEGLEGIRADVDGDHVGALGCEPHRVRASLAAGGSGYQRDLAINESHGASSPLE